MQICEIVLCRFNRYLLEIPEPVPSLSWHSAPSGGIQVFPMIRITMIRQVCMYCGLSVKMITREMPDGTQRLWTHLLSLLLFPHVWSPEYSQLGLHGWWRHYTWRYRSRVISFPYLWLLFMCVYLHAQITVDAGDTHTQQIMIILITGKIWIANNICSFRSANHSLWKKYHIRSNTRSCPITAHQRHFQFKICGTINHPLKSSHPLASDYMPSRYWIPKTTNWRYVNFHLLTIRLISFFYQLFKLTNFEPCNNQHSLWLGHLSLIC